MLLFKTSGTTYGSVLTNQKHAFFKIPKGWFSGEFVLISKNRKDCRKKEKQIQYIMYLNEMRPTTHTEIEKYWPNNLGRWKYIADCYEATALLKPFDLDDLLELNEARVYKNITPAMKIHPKHEEALNKYLKFIDAAN